MQKVYLLLRNNKQTGPHSLDELLQLGLKPFDLVWVEGRSGGWSYPSEIETLKPYAGEAPVTPVPYSTESMPSTHPTYAPSDTTTSSSPKSTVPPKNVFVSLPGKGVSAPALQKEVQQATDWDRRVEELRQRAQSFTTLKEAEEEAPSLNTNYARSLNEVEEEYTDWVYQQKVKKKPVLTSKQISTLAIGIILVGGGYLAATSLLGGDQQKSAKSIAVKQAPHNEPATGELQTESTPEVYEEETPLKGEVSPALTQKEIRKPNNKTLSTGMIAVVPDRQPVESTQKTAHQLPVKEHHTVEEVEAGQEEPEAAIPQVKKKSLAEKIDGFIEKIASKGPKGTGKEVEEEAPKTAPAPGAGERRSTRRSEEGAAAADPAELARQVEVVANNSDNWMMGVKDLKLTVRNNSSVTIKRAAIEISYYSESDNLLEKKTVYVSGIPPKGRKTIAAPDQRMADHVDFRVLSASADEEAYAQQ